MPKKAIKNILYGMTLFTLCVWLAGFWGYWGTGHTIALLSLIILIFATIFIGVIIEDNFL